MRSVPALRFAALLGLAVTTFSLVLTSGRPACAQSDTTGTSDQGVEPALAVRLGAYLPQNDQIKNQISNTFYGGGIDYTFQNVYHVSRTIISADYITGNDHGLSATFVPVTIGQMYEQNVANGVRPYLGFGLGAYFVHSELNDSSANKTTNDKALFGGYAAAGLDLASNFFVDARYHFVTNSGGLDASGLQVSVGVRF